MANRRNNLGYLLFMPLVFLFVVSCSDDDDPMSPEPFPPTADAGLPQESNPGVDIILDGSGSVGEGLSFLWTQVSGASVSLTDSTSVATTFTTPDDFGVLAFELTVTGTGGLTDSDGTLIYVMAEGNRPPTAEAGANQRVGIGTTVGLFGSGTDPDGDDLTFAWRQVAGQPEDIALAPDASVAQPTFTAPAAPTTLTFELTVDDGNGGVSRDSTDVIVEASPTPGVPFLWVLSVPGGGRPNNIGGWQLASLPLPESDPLDPARLIQGGETMLDLGATDMVVDAQGAVLASISPFTEAPRITSYLPVESGNGNIAPDRTVAGSATLLRNPVAMALDRPGDILYVVDEDGILVFNNVSSATFNGDVAPSRVILPFSSRYDAQAVSLGPGGRLYVADRNVDNGSVWVYDDAATADGRTAPSRIISNSSTVGLTDVFVAPDDRMYVSVPGSSGIQSRVHVWDNASTVEPGQAPDRTIFPSFGNSDPSTTIVDSENRGFALDQGRNRIFIYADFHSADGGTNATGGLSSNKLTRPISVVIDN